MTKIIVPVILSLFLIGCAQLGTVKKVVGIKGAQLNDQALIDAEWVVCKAASHGSVDRRYGQTVDRANLHKEFCHGEGAANTVGPVK